MLAGHDHTYTRGYQQSTATSMNGVTAGPVYVLANSGQKLYPLSPAESNTWTRNGAVPVKRAQGVASYQSVKVDGDTLSFKSVVTFTGSGAAAGTNVGDTLDEFTITKRDDGAKWVTEPGVAVPGPEVPPVNVDKPSDVPFDAATYGQVAFDDDFSTDRLSEYSVFGDEGENPSDYSVDTTAGVLNSTSTSRKWTNFALPATGGNKFAVIVEPKSFVSGVLPEDTLFVGSTDGPGNSAYSWYHNGRTSGGLHVYKGGQRQELSQSPTGKTVSWQPGDRFATVFDNGQMTSYIEKNGVWEPIRSGALQLTLTRDQINSWTPSFGIRQDGGTIAIDRVTVLVPGEAPQPVEVTPAVVTFTDAAGTADDVYEIPVAQGVEYLVDGAPMGAGTYAGVGTVTVTARAVDGYVLADGAQAEWAFAFTDVPGTDPGTDPGTEPTPDAPSESDLTDANRGDLGISGPVVAGSALTVTVGASLAGKTVWAWLFSSPAALGSATVNAAGEARFIVPATMPAGQHRLAVVGSDGSIIGWSDVTVIAAPADDAGAPPAAGDDAGALPATGGSLLGVGIALSVALLLLGLGAAVMIARRRRMA